MLAENQTNDISTEYEYNVPNMSRRNGNKIKVSEIDIGVSYPSGYSFNVEVIMKVDVCFFNMFKDIP